MLAPDWFAHSAENSRPRLVATLPMEQHRKKRKEIKKTKWTHVIKVTASLILHARIELDFEINILLVQLPPAQ